jgi:hypothetical protein
MHFKKHFTLPEARALLPRLRQMIRDAQRRRQFALRADQELGELLDNTHADLGGPVVHSLLMDLTQMNGQLRAIEKLGVQFKDFERGLVDFPHLRDGREVFLCWELDEENIEFWHDIDAGYPGREKL